MLTIINRVALDVNEMHKTFNNIQTRNVYMYACKNIENSVKTMNELMT